MKRISRYDRLNSSCNLQFRKISYHKKENLYSSCRVRMYYIGVGTVCTSRRGKLCPGSSYVKRWRVCASSHADDKLVCGSDETSSELMLLIYGCPMSLALQWANKNKIPK